MKCIAAVVMMALVACSSASVSPLVYSAVHAYHSAPAYHHHGGPLTYSSLPESKLVATHYAAHAPVLAYSAPAHYEHAHYEHAPAHYEHAHYEHAPLAYHHHEHAPVAYHHAHVVAAPVAYTAVHEEAKYLAANRGAVHEAPLPGHHLSQTSLNLAPAK